MREYSITSIALFIIGTVTGFISNQFPGYGMFDLGNMLCWLLASRYLLLCRNESRLFVNFGVFCFTAATAHFLIDTIWYHSILSHSLFYLDYDIPNYMCWLMYSTFMLENSYRYRRYKIDHVAGIVMYTVLSVLSVLCVIELSNIKVIYKLGLVAWISFLKWFITFGVVYVVIRSKRNMFAKSLLKNSRKQKPLEFIK